LGDLKLHGPGGVHTELTVRKNRTGHHDHVNSQEVTELIRELALVCEDSAIVSILNRLGYRTGIGNTWTEQRVQHVRHAKGFPACPPPEQRRWLTVDHATGRSCIESKRCRCAQACHSEDAPGKTNRQLLSLDDRAGTSGSSCCPPSGPSCPCWSARSRMPNDAQIRMFGIVRGDWVEVDDSSSLRAGSPA
jgi:hypothetical protein